MFEQFRAGKIPFSGALPEWLPGEVETRLLLTELKNEAREVDRMPDFAVPVVAAMSKRHTYLFDESVWLVSGVYINEKSISVDVEGDSVISHRNGRWFNEVNMELKAEHSTQYRNLQYKTVYEYAPIESVREASVWHASNALLGRLHGVLVFVDDTILSSYQTTNGSIRGMEALRLITEYEYQCHGALFEAGKKSSSWILQIRSIGSDRQASPPNPVMLYPAST